MCSSCTINHFIETLVIIFHQYEHMNIASF